MWMNDKPTASRVNERLEAQSMLGYNHGLVGTLAVGRREVQFLHWFTCTVNQWPGKASVDPSEGGWCMCRCGAGFAPCT